MKSDYRRALIFLLFMLFIIPIWFEAGDCAENRFKPSQTELTYLLSIDEKTWNSYRVSITLDKNREKRINFVIPNWIPGIYTKMNFCLQVTNFQAYGEQGKELLFEQLKPNTWSVKTAGTRALRIIYDIQVSKRGFIGKALSAKGVLIRSPSVFMYVEEHTHLPITVRFRVPQNWKIATSLNPGYYLYEYTAENYDELVDSPVMMGNFRDYYFNYLERTFTITISGRVKFSINHFLVMIRKIVLSQIELFNDIPFNNYYFMFHIFPDILENAGMDHARSATISLSGSILDKDAKSPAKIIAREFFQLWNGKRIRSKCQYPIDYSKGNRTKVLWFTEGVSSYYADLTLVRTKLWTIKQFLESQAHHVKTLQENSARLESTLEEASWNVWERPYTSSCILFYNKGHLLGLLLDLKIRDVTDNQRSLNDVMRFMNWWFAKSDIEFENQSIPRTVSAVTQQDFDEFFDKYVRGTVELPYAEILAVAGINVSLSDWWGPDLGKIRLVGNQNRIIVLEEDGPLAKAGLKQGDRLVAIDTTKIERNEDIINAIMGKKISDTVLVHVKRDGVPLKLRSELRKKKYVSCSLTLTPSPSEKQLRIRNDWLGIIPPTDKINLMRKNQ